MCWQKKQRSLRYAETHRGLSFEHRLLNWPRKHSMKYSAAMTQAIFLCSTEVVKQSNLFIHRMVCSLLSDSYANWFHYFLHKWFRFNDGIILAEIWSNST
jgi:hypothetical protein